MCRLHALLLGVSLVLFLIVCVGPQDTSSQGTQNSLSLNGTSSYVSVPNSSSINISGPITVEAWIRLNSVTGNYQDILCRESWGQAGTGGGYEFAITSTGKVRLDLYQSHNQYTTAIGATTVTANAWHHVAGVFDGNQIRVYLNGVLDGSLSTTNGPASGTSALNIGKSTYTGYYFGGLIDEVRISAAALYTTNFTPGLGPGSNTRAWWKFNGPTTNDSSGNANHGTLQGGAGYSTNVPTIANSGPSVTITDPISNAAFAAGSTIVIDAAATDSDGSISRVDFYQGATLLGSDTDSPYTFLWNNVPTSTYSLTAKATDDSGAITTSSAVTVNVLESSAQHSLSLNGTSSYVSVPNSSSINISGPITVEAWIKLNSVTGNYQDILCRETWGQAGTGGGYEFAITSTGKVRLDLYQSHNQYTTAIGATTVTANAWHHVAGVFDGNQIRVYLNGVLDGSLSTTNGPASGTSPLNIGKSTYTGYYFGGLIDEVRISAAALYTTNFTPGLGPGSNTRAWWKFNGPTTNDSSGNANHGTLQGGAGYSTVVPPASSGGGSQRPVPMAGGPYNGQLSQPVQFSSNGSFDPDGTITAYHWNFGDGTSVNVANPTHTYQTSGLFTATLTVTDNSGLMFSATTSVSINGSSEARLDPRNATGGSAENPLSRNFNWTVPLVSLPGRAGLDLNLNLSYNSLVWTKRGASSISFDDDYGFPSPGFRLGFPTIQTAYLNPETGQWSYLLIGSDGRRIELRRVTPTSVFYESADSSHLLLDTTNLTASDPKMILKTTDGTQLTYKPKGVAYECTEIKDRNGNYITINYNSAGRISNIQDTLNRTITFVYQNGSLTSIEQQWKQPSNPSNQITHTWASFDYVNVPIQTNFTGGIAVNGPANGSSVKMLSRVTLDDNSTTPSQNSHYDFEFTSWGQVWKISNFAADNHLLNYRSYNLPQNATIAQSDCPRFTERRDWAEKWNRNTSGIEQEAVTTYTDLQSGTASVPGQGSQSARFVQITNPDQTFTKIYYLGTAGTPSGWRVGLQYLVESYDVGGTTPQRQVASTWTQDHESKQFILNPRVVETNVFDSSNNRKRTEIQYQSYSLGNDMSCQLPQDVREYDQTGATVLRTTRTIYVDDSAYLSRRIIGLPKESLLYEGVVSPANLQSKQEFKFDEPNSIEGNDSAVQHDPAYSSTFVVGRGNLTTVKRFDVENLSSSTNTTMKYNTAGSLVSSKDPLNHETRISYLDSFSDGISRNTLAYPTRLTDPDNYFSTSKYNFDFGALTYRQTPPSNYVGASSNQPAGPEQTLEYYDHGRLKKQNNLVNNAYTMFVYESSGVKTNSYSTIQEGLGEAHSFTVTDGAGRIIATALANPDNPGKTGAFRAKRFIHDVLGRVIRTSNLAETNAIGNDPSQWTTTDHDEVSDWIYTKQTYDWMNRPKITTNVDDTTKQVDYSGCGCAGGEVITLMDEGTNIAGVNKRRLQKIYSDSLGRTVKNEVWDFEGTGPGGTGRRLDSTTVTTYNTRDQVKMVRQFAGAAPSPDDLSCPNGTCQKTEYTYDGFGRLKTKHLPEQSANAVTSWTYNGDDSINTIVDGRGAIASFSYLGTNRGLVKSVTHSHSGSSTISLNYEYDAAANRIAMVQSIAGAPHDSISYVYDQLSRLTAETKHINALESNPSTQGDYTIGYQYTLSGKLKSVTDPFNATTNINYDATGRTLNVSSNYGGTNHTHISNVGYRAWGGVRSMRLGSLNETRTYNRRLQPVQYRYAQYRYDYTYYDDGKLKELIDLDDQVGSPSQVQFHYMSRLYHYDYAGRVSGVVGRPNTGVPPPFGGAYSFDEFGNMKSRGGNYALNPTTSDAANYLNNRRNSNGWNYDQDGRLQASGDSTTASNQTWTYDARGNSSTISETISGTTPTTTTNTLKYDGNGELLFESVSTPIETKTDYLIHSTVLGTVLTKLDGSGNKDTTYVPANGLAMVTQTKDFNGNPVIGGAIRDASGLQEDGKAVDPFGARVMNVQPPDSSQQNANLRVFGPPYAGYGLSRFTDANNLSTGCMLDKVRTACASVLNALNRGLATGVISYNGSAASIANLIGYMPMTHRTTTFVSGPSYEGFTLPGRYVTSISTEFVPILGYDPAAPADPQDPGSTNEYTGPCPPTKAELAENPIVKATLDEAADRAQKRRVEHGGWIFWNPKSGKIATYIKPPTIAPLNTDINDNYLRVFLNNPPPTPKGWLIVGTFHTHPEDVNEDPQDIVADDERKVPGMVRMPDGKISPYGNYNRGIWNRELPQRCK